VLVRQGDAVHALAGNCPHRGVPMEKGTVVGDRIICGIHRAAFALSSGELLSPPACENLARYDVRVDGDAVHVTVDEDTESHPLPAMTKGGSDERSFVILGNGAAGWRAAETLRREGFEGKITVVTDETERPLDRTEFSKSYLGSSDEPEAPFLREAGLASEYGIDIANFTATALDPKTNTLRGGAGESLTYDSLFIATGSDAATLNIPRKDLAGIHTLRTLEDAEALRADLQGLLKDGEAKIAIIGAGFIGLEAAASLSGQDNVSVTVVAMEDKPMLKLFGESFANRLMKEHDDAGVTFRTGAKTVGFSGEGRVSVVEIDGGSAVAADLVIVAVGARPRTNWLPFERDADGGISVNADLSVPGHDNIFVGGDIARVPTKWGHVRIEHWRFAQELGELAARNMLGAGANYDGTPFFWTAQQIEGSYFYTGHADSFDRIEGAPEGGQFASRYIKDGKVTAVLQHGIDDEVTALERGMAGQGPVPA
ncbi:MAG: FAD-dependent oxidoreductase, partial [Pseudomonadota bacterium]